jgi:hypothetical protein
MDAANNQCLAALHLLALAQLSCVPSDGHAPFTFLNQGHRSDVCPIKKGASGAFP